MHAIFTPWPWWSRRSRDLVLLFALCLCAPHLGAGEQAAAPAAQGTCHALLIAGLPGTPIHARQYKTWLTEFRQYLTAQAKVPAAQVQILSGDKTFKAPFVQGVATVETIQKALADMAKTVKQEDQFVLFIVGHGVVTERPPTLVLPGTDLDAEQLAAGINAIRAHNQVILNFSASSGTALRLLAKPGRLNITSTAVKEGNASVLPEFFLRGLRDNRADGEGAPKAGKKDGIVTMLEAYNWATYQTALWISRIRVVGQSKQWRVDGKESVEIFKKLYSGPKGQPGARQLHPSSRANVPDPIVPIKPKDGIIDGSWMGKRILSEHAQLEDCGEELGVCALRESGYEPLAGHREGEPGWLARRIVLGRATLLPAGDG